MWHFFLYTKNRDTTQNNPRKESTILSESFFVTSRATCLDADAGEYRNIHLSLNKCIHAHTQERSGGG